MPTYIVLTKFTEKATQDLPGLPDRMRDVRSRIEARGGRVIGWYLTQGQYDAVNIVESPDEMTALGGLLRAAADGYVRTESLRAYTLEEIEPILKQM